ncbi:ABC transporter permease [Paraburkholderia sp. IW21]|uniref:ABC transporter permease n=1 Tax=Paraburkholderia sp. IW21 TaxID=3242488 RepID=UPI0035205215
MKRERHIGATTYVGAAIVLVLTLGCTAARADNWLSGVAQYRSDIIYQSIQQMTMVAIAGVLAIVVAVPVGIYMSRPSQRHGSAVVMQTLNVGQAIPKLALLALAMSVLGIGRVPAIFGLWVATLLPIALNTYEGLRAVPRPLIEAATGMGMTPLQILWRVELPNALYVIFAGIRTALAITVGTAPLAFLIGGGGLGELIFTGIDLNDFTMLLAGAIPTALLAILTDAFVGQMQRRLVSPGVTP